MKESTTGLIRSNGKFHIYDFDRDKLGNWLTGLSKHTYRVKLFFSLIALMMHWIPIISNRLTNSFVFS